MADPDIPADGLEIAELRGRLRGRWKAERREHEREALHEHWSQRTLIDAIRESMNRGDHLAIHLPCPRTLTGHIPASDRTTHSCEQPAPDLSAAGTTNPVLRE